MIQFSTTNAGRCCHALRKECGNRLDEITVEHARSFRCQNRTGWWHEATQVQRFTTRTDVGKGHQVCPENLTVDARNLQVALAGIAITDHYVSTKYQGIYLKMGWLIYDRAPQNIREEVDRICTFETDARSATPVKTCRVCSVRYVAVQVTVKEGAPLPDDYQVDDLGQFTFAAVIKTRRDRDGWGYRVIEEEAGPAYSQAPRSLIEMLTPTSSEWAKAWRNRCLANAARRSRQLRDGDIIAMATPMQFTDGRARSTFKVIKEKPPGYQRGRTIFECTETAAQRDWRRVA